MRIAGEPGSRVVWIDDRPLSPFRSQRVMNHSPDGFNWGYDGSGPAQLALAILLAAGLPKQRAVELHQQFKREILAPLPQGRRFAIEIDVAAWAQRVGQGDEAARYEYRRDGWPLCPQCGEDELMSLAPPSVSRRAEPIDRMRCLVCQWEGFVPARDATYAIESIRGVQAIRCLFCNRISELPGDVANRYCGRCHLFHEAVAEGRRLVALGGVHECQEWRTAGDVCALCGAPIAKAAL